MTASNKTAAMTAGLRIALAFAILALIVGGYFLTFGDQGFGTALIVVGVIDLVIIGIHRASKAAWLRLKAAQTE